MRKYIVELTDPDGVIAILQVQAPNAEKARSLARRYIQEQGWGWWISAKSHILSEKESEVIHLTTIHPKIVPVERKYNYTPTLEYV